MKEISMENIFNELKQLSISLARQQCFEMEVLDLVLIEKQILGIKGPFK